MVTWKTLFGRRPRVDNSPSTVPPGDSGTPTSVDDAAETHNDVHASDAAEPPTRKAEMSDTPMASGDLATALQLSMDSHAVESEWVEEAGGVVRGSKHVRAPGFGTFGIVSLQATLTPQAGGYECRITAGCLPLSTDATETMRTLEDAKAKTEEVWGNLIAAMALIFLKMPGSR